MFQSNLTNGVNFKIDVNANVTNNFKCRISIGSKYRLEKTVSWCTQEGVCFLYCYKRVKVREKENQNFSKIHKIQLLEDL